MAANGDNGRGAGGSLVDASGYKFSDKDTKPGKIKLKKNVKTGKTKKGDDHPAASPNASPILPGLDAKTMAAFPTGKPREEDHIETVICKTCKRPILKHAAVDHIRGCLKAKQEKARKKKEARDAANRAKEKIDGKDGDDDDKLDGEDAMTGQKSAKKSAVKGMADDGTKKGKKRKADAGGGEDDKDKEPKKKEARDAANRAKEKIDGKDGDDDDKLDGEDAMTGQKSAKKSAVKGMADDGTKKGKKRKADAGGGEDDKDKEPKKKKKKDEPKPKVPKPKGPVDVEKQCGVTLPNGAQCARSLTCKSHSMGAKRAVPGRSLPYDMLLQAYQKKNQARQQKAAIDANAPQQDEFENNGPVDSDEEKDSVMAAIGRSNPLPLATHTVVSTRNKYHYVRIKEMLSHALGGARGGGLFSTGDSNPPSADSGGGNLFQTEGSSMVESPDASGDPDNSTTVDTSNQSPVPKPSMAVS